MKPGPSCAIAENPWLVQSVRIDNITAEVPNVATYHLRFEDPDQHAEYEFRPGQFNMLYVPGAGEIAVSLSGGSRVAGSWDHTIRVAGNVTRSIARMAVGGSLGLRGPYGSWWPVDDCDGADFILIAGGIGLPPLRPVIQQLLSSRKRFGHLDLLYGARTPDTLLYAGEYQSWSNAGLDVQTTVDRAPVHWLGNVGVVPLLLDRLQPLSPGNTVVFACGPEIMLHYIAQRSGAWNSQRSDVGFTGTQHAMCRRILRPLSARAGLRL